MDVLIAAPVLVKVFASLAIIILLNKFTKNLMVSAAAGAAVLGFWSGNGFWDVCTISWDRFSHADNIMLMLVILQVITLSRQMSETGVMKDLVAAVQSRLSKRSSMAVLPAVIGLLPMPGGAIFSAPLVDNCDEDNSLSALLKTRINYWFRHSWEYWWPLYPGVLLALAITKLEVWQFMLLQFPLTVFSIGTGYFFFLRKVKVRENEGPPREKKSLRHMLELVTPILIIIGTFTIFKLKVIIFGDGIGLNKYVPIALGIFLAIYYVQRKRPLDRGSWKKILLSKKAYLLALLVAVVRIYGAFIEADLPDGTALVDKMRDELNSAGVPLMAVAMVIPFVSGMATGIAVGFVGASLPIAIKLLGADPGIGVLMSTTILAYGFGYIGMMLSPMHICLIVTNEHFKTRLSRSIIKLLKPASVMLCLIMLYYVLIRLIFPA